MDTLIGTARLNDVDPQAWLADMLDRIADLPQTRLHELLPWHRKAERAQALTSLPHGRARASRPRIPVPALPTLCAMPKPCGDMRRLAYKAYPLASGSSRY